ncbi:MAG: extracellular metalloproteinase, partial [Tepidisphaeraceae bacterium]
MFFPARRTRSSSTPSRLGSQTSRACGLIDPLERRLLLAAAVAPVKSPVSTIDLVQSSYVPASKYVFKSNGYLTKPAAGDALDIALSYVRSNAASFGIAAADVGNPIVTSRYTDSGSGITHIYLRQQFNGLEVANADININVMRDGRISSIGCGFVAGLGSRFGPEPIAPALTLTTALNNAAQILSLDQVASPTVLIPSSGIDQRAVVRASALSLDDIPARLHYVATPTGAELAWDFIIRTTDNQHWYDTSISASSGKMLFTADWTDSFAAPGTIKPAGGASGSAQLSTGPETAAYSATYNVYPYPSTGPDSGGRTMVTDPWDLNSSQYGWHDTNGTSGGDDSTTAGNNVSAQDDTDANNSGGVRPSGGAFGGGGTGSLTFNYGLLLTDEPAVYLDAATVNLFYWNNILHDIHYRYGFTEAAGNFQLSNYGLGGLGNDRVQADAQDGSGTNNANFSTPVDGSSGRMQMFRWTSTTPSRDSDLDSGVIIHEYGHGVSNRLTGGPGNSSALNQTQSAGMGEGWSDWWALMLLQTDGSVAAQNSSIGIGTYVIGQPLSGSGIRRYRYSYDMTINPET